MSLAPPSRLPDFAIACALWIASTLVIVTTNDMGFVRDEAFYFGHAEGYQNWFVKLEAGGDKRQQALTRQEISDTWRANAEHPPLDKLMFGWSWRLLGRKLRPAERTRDQAGQLVVEVADLGPAHGFETGADVVLLRPQLVDGPSSPEGRPIALGKVMERTDSKAVVQLSTDGSRLAQLLRLCQPAGPSADGKGPIRRTGCEVLERRVLYVLSESNAMRLPGALFGGMVVALIFLCGRLWFAGRMTAAGTGRLERPFAVLAAVGYLCIPQAFWHAHLCTFDTTITALLLATTVAWHRSLTSRPWIWVAAVLWGFALLAKHNALFLPLPLLAHWLVNAGLERRIVAHWPAGNMRIVGGTLLAIGLGTAASLLHPLVGAGCMMVVLAAAGLRLELPPVPAVFLTMLAIGPAMLIVGWPLLWHDTFDNLLRWVEFHLHHEHYMQSYFGQVLQYPPFPPQFAWVMTALTWPLTLLVPVALGLLAVYLPRKVQIPPPVLDVERHDAWLFADREDDRGRSAELRSWDRLVLLSAVWPLLLISMPGTPIFGGTKHWMPAFPFLLLIGARGVQAVWRTLAARYHDVLGDPRPVATVAAWALALVLLAPAAWATSATYKHGAAYYNELVGGVSGAAQAGMQRQFWGGSTREGLEVVNRRAPQGASIWFHKAAWGSYQMYVREGWFRHDLRYSAEPAGTQMGLYHHQKDHDDYETDLMRQYRWRAPVYQYAIDGAPILSVYERPVVAQLPAPRLP